MEWGEDCPSWSIARQFDSSYSFSTQAKVL